MNDIFNRFARWASDITGSAWAFLMAAMAIVIWGVTGPIFRFSDTWQLVINTSTTIITFLMVFLIQNTQNRDSRAMHLKIDELIRSQKGARNSMIDLEKLTDIQLARLQQEFDKICSENRLDDDNPIEDLHDEVDREADRRQSRSSSDNDRNAAPGTRTGQGPALER